MLHFLIILLGIVWSSWVIHVIILHHKKYQEIDRLNSVIQDLTEAVNLSTLKRRHLNALVRGREEDMRIILADLAIALQKPNFNSKDMSYTAKALQEHLHNLHNIANISERETYDGEEEINNPY